MIVITLEDDLFRVRSPYNENLVPVLRNIFTAKWNRDLKAWEYRASPGMAYTLAKRLKAWGFEGDMHFKHMLKQYALQRMSQGQAAPDEVKICQPNFDHQNTGLALSITREYIYLTWEMGTGKSKVVVDTVGALNLRNTLIVCPRTVIQEWPRQFQRWGYGYNVRCVPLERGTVQKRMKVAHTALSRFPSVIVINYDAVWRQPFNKWALKREWDLVVADECHRIKGHKSRVSKFFNELREFAKKRIALSGTPIPNNPLDLWAQCRFLDPYIFGDSFTGFRNRYGVVKEFNKKTEDEDGNRVDAVKEDGTPDTFRTVVAFRNLDKLHEVFGKVSHRVTKEECLDLPPVMDETREVELGKKGAKLYTEMDSAFQVQIDNREITIANALVEMLRLQQCTGGAVKYDDSDEVEEIDTAKQEVLEDILEEIELHEPMVVFCRFHHDLDAVHAAASKTGRKSVELSGRRNQLAEWRDTRSKDGQPTVLAVQIQSGGIGVNLTRARYGAYYSLGASYGDYQQSRSRQDRQGQTRKITFYHILGKVDGKRTIDHDIYDALSEKGDVARTVIAKRRLTSVSD